MLIERSDNPAAVSPLALEKPEEPKPEETTFFDAAGPAFRWNMAGKLRRAEEFQEDDETFDPHFRPFDEIKGTKYEPYWEDAVDIPNRKAFTKWKAKTDAWEDDQRTIDAAGWGGVGATLLATIVDLPTLIPGGSLVSDVRAGVNVAQTGIKTGLLGGTAAGLDEAVAQAVLPSRSAAESGIAIGGSVFLSALLGSSVAAISAARFKKAADKLSRELFNPGPVATDKMEAHMQSLLTEAASAGAAKVPSETIDDLTIEGSLAKLVADKTARLNPLLDSLASPSLKTRELATSLMENPTYLKKNARGIASKAAVETIVKEHQGAAIDALLYTRNAYKKARQNGFSGTMLEFNERVGRAMRRGDVDPGGLEEVTAASKYWRSKVFDPLKDQAIELKRLPEDVRVDTAVSYFSRLYNVQKIEAQEQRFLNIVRNWLSREIGMMEEKSGAEFASMQDRLDYIDEVARGIYDKVTGRESMMGLPLDIVASDRGPLKERTFSIPDEDIEEFLIDDVERVGRRYARIMGAEVELTRAHGSSHLKDKLDEIKDDYRKLRDAAKDEKTKAALSKREKRDIQNIEGVRDMLRGTYKAEANGTNYGRILAAARTFNYLRLMGGVVLSSLTDVARPMMVHGMRAFLKDGIKPLVTNLKGIKMSAKEARLAGTIGESVAHSRMAGWAELTDPYSLSSPAERMLNNMATGFSKVSGISYWTDFMKTVSSVMTQNRIIRNVGNYAGLAQKEKRYLAYLGIDEDMASRIQTEIAKHGDDADGVLVANTERWTDPVARRAYRAAMNKDVDSIIVTKGIGDVPLFANTPTGKTLLQFKSFALASHQRAFIRGMQEGNAGILSGLINSTLIGMFIYWLKSVESNKTDKLSDNIGTWIAEGLDRSGLFSVLFEINNIAEKIGVPGIYEGLGKMGQMVNPDASIRTRASRYGARSVVEAGAGPTFGLAANAAQLANAALSGEMTKGDVTTAFGLLPFRTLPVIRSALDYYAIPEAKEAVEQ